MIYHPPFYPAIDDQIDGGSATGSGRNPRREDSYIKIGGSWDPISFKDLSSTGGDLQLGLFINTAGLPDKGTAYQFYGGGVEARQYLFSESARKPLNPYLGAGYGVYGTKFDLGHVHTHMMLAPRVFAGVQLPIRVFVEATYDYFGTHYHRDLSGLGFSVGYRF
jgi:hypothetical protein